MGEEYGVLDELGDGAFLYICVDRNGKTQHEYYEENEEGALIPVGDMRSVLDDIRYAGTFE